jgi:hypothetical protein
MTTIYIHEFSTGINVKGTKDSWHSTGFTGYYMNSTLSDSNFPEAVRQEIAADLFKLAESSIQEVPVLIGREVKLGDEKWSVLAVVNTAGRDESGRIIAVTRFFLTEGLGKLNDLVTYQRTHNLKFDPFDNKKLNQPNKYNTKDTKETNILPIVFDNSSFVVNNLLASPLILSTVLTNKNEKIPIKAIHQLAQEKSKTLGNKLITWAYNVEGLKKPHDFLVIYSASAKADQYLQQSLKVKQQGVERKEGEQEILTIVRTWINNAEVQSDELNVIEQALNYPAQYDNIFWEQSIFGELGIRDAIEGSYAPSFIRLYLLYILPSPDKFPEFLVWLDEKSHSNKQKEERCKVAIDFSNKLLLAGVKVSNLTFTPIIKKAFEGIDYIISGLPSSSHDRKYLFPREKRRVLLSQWLELDKHGLWGQTYYTFYGSNLWKDIEELSKIQHDSLSTASQYLQILNRTTWTVISEDLIKLIKKTPESPYQFKSDYLHLAQFFESIDSENSINNRLSAIFYSMSGYVPIHIWKKLNINKKAGKYVLKTLDGQRKILLLYRQLGQDEIIGGQIRSFVLSSVNFLSESKEISAFRLWYATFFLGGLAFAVFILGFLVLNYHNFSKIGFIQKLLNSIGLITTFDTTTGVSLNQVVNEFNNKLKISGTPTTKDEVKLKIAEVLDESKIHNLAFDTKDRQPIAWISAISDYQEQAKMKPTGIITLGDKTDKRLKCELHKSLQLPINSQKIVDCGNSGIVLSIRQANSTTPTPTPTPIPTPTPLNTTGNLLPGAETSGNWLTTSKALDSLQDEIVKNYLSDKDKDKDKVGNEIAKILTSGVAPYQFKDGKGNGKDNSELWIEGIQKFQNKTSNYSDYGFITKDDPTYNLLKCEVAKNLKITLKSPPAECSQNS